MNEEICQGCGKPIQWGQNVIAVRYGKITASVRHTSVSKNYVDYFHPECPKAFRNSRIIEDIN